MNNLSRLALPALLLAFFAGGLHAQSYCSSDGQPQPVALVERFVNADCETCWGDARTAQTAAGELALDWIVPGSRGEDAPLSAAAAREGLERLQVLRQPVPAQASVSRRPVQRDRRALRVAHGLPFNGYIGTSIELKPGNAGPWHAWLLLVETIPAGSDGTPVTRNLVRNALQQSWDGAGKRSGEAQGRLFEARPMSIPEGAKPARLRVVGWVEDARGRIRAIAQSACAPQPTKG